jgi:hypothetical protein
LEIRFRTYRQQIVVIGIRYDDESFIPGWTCRIKIPRVVEGNEMVPFGVDDQGSEENPLNLFEV